MIWSAPTTFLPSMQADTLIADKAFDADERVIAPRLRPAKRR